MGGTDDGRAFLPQRRARHWSPEDPPAGIDPVALYLPDQGQHTEVVYARAARRPKVADLRSLWQQRWNRRPSAVLLVAGYDGADGPEAAVIGLRDQAEVAFHPLDEVRRAVVKALTEPRPSAAEQILGNLLQRHDPDAVPGLQNSGLFATYELLHRVPERSDWAAAAAAVSSVRHAHGPDLLGALGWTLEREGEDYLLGGDGRHDAVAVVLEGDDVFDRSGSRYSGSTPVEHGLALAHRHRIHWVLAVKGTIVRLYAAEPDIGIARKGTATFTHLDLALLPDDRLGYAGLLLTPGALRDGGTVAEILTSSSDHAATLGTRLRTRIYDDVIPDLATVVAGRLGDSTETGLDRAYHVTLVILFRLLFVAYAEDRGLLPYRSNHSYTDKALKTRARRYSDEIAETGSLTFDAKAVDLWQDLTAIWTGIHDGHREWSIPAYGGSLFDPFDATGTAIAAMTLTNREIGPALRNMLVDTGPDGTRGPVDFQTLSVREFGTIYEGLLESSLSVAPSDLTLDRNSAYVPARAGDDVVARAGSIYFHNASGARKATGSYFTKEFAVEHLLRTALEPSIDDHLARVGALLDDGREADAADALFDFRVADLAMGSGHFLIGAIDHLGSRISTFLVDRPIPHALAELNRLRTTAADKLTSAGVLVDQTIDQMGLVRRQVARRCIYGIDVNRIAVDLARLAVWIHTFVPGLPMSTLEHGLVVGNSLTGIGTLDEALDALDPGKDGTHSLFRQDIEDGLAAAAEPLRRVGVLAEATIEESAEAAALIREAQAAVEPVRRALDAAVAGRLGLLDLRTLTVIGWPAVVEAGRRPGVQAEVGRLQALHFPVAFPEVFQRENPGFDVILGNPPWEEATVEENKFWGMFDPTLRSASSSAQVQRIDMLRSARPDLYNLFRKRQSELAPARKALLAGPFPGMGTGDPDLYKAFVWRFWTQSTSGGSIGVVLPRSAWAALGSAPWRAAVLPVSATSIAVVVNESEWLFTDVNPGWHIALSVIRKGAVRSQLNVVGPFASRKQFEQGVRSAIQLPLDLLAASDPSLSVPTVDGRAGLALFCCLVAHPPIGAQRSDFRVTPATELHATNDGKKLFFTGRPTDYPVYNHANVDHFLFNPNAGAFNYVDFQTVGSELQARRVRTQGRADSPMRFMTRAWALDRATLPMLHPRLVFRDVVHASNPRKIWAAVAPSNTILTNTAPYLVMSHGSTFEQAYLLGVLGSSVCDWFCHARVVLHMSFFIFNSIPVPTIDHSRNTRRIATLAARLALQPSGDYGDWRALGDPIIDPPERDEALGELDALVSLLYGVEEDWLPLIFDGRTTRPALATVRAWRDKATASS